MQLRTLSRALFCLVLLACIGASPSRAHAWAGGGHLGLNLDNGDIHIGGDLLFPLAEVSPSVRLAFWPSVAYVFDAEVLLLGADLPFEFLIADSPIVPFVGPGLGLAINDNVNLKLNIIGGIFIETNGPVRPFAELALRFIRGTYVDLLFGVMFEV
jgi:hypothetical protein